MNTELAFKRVLISIMFHVIVVVQLLASFFLIVKYDTLCFRNYLSGKKRNTLEKPSVCQGEKTLFIENTE